MRDTGNQLVLGTFVATFLYSLLVLRTIGREADGSAVPHASVMAAVALAVASLAVLIYFIHHVSLSLQAPMIVANVAAELQQSLGRIFPRDVGHGPRGPDAESEDPQLPPSLAGPGAAVPSPKDGYLQAIDQQTLMSLAVEHDLAVKLLVRPGDYLIKGNPVMCAHPADRCPDRVAGRFAKLLIIGRERTPEQDVEFAIHQLVEVAVRALSPGVNDPYTASTGCRRRWWPSSTGTCTAATGTTTPAGCASWPRWRRSGATWTRRSTRSASTAATAWP
jgi:uncharacterized membrane protein